MPDGESAVFANPHEAPEQDPEVLDCEGMLSQWWPVLAAATAPTTQCIT